MASHSRGAPKRATGKDSGGNVVIRSKAAMSPIKMPTSIGCAAVATSTGRVAKLVAMKAPNLEPRGNNPKPK